MNNLEEILTILNQDYPNAKCELNYRNSFELLIAAILSAQTTDKSVNQVTIELFNKYGDCYKLASAEQDDIIKIISRLGLSKNKSSHIINTSKIISEKFQGNIPSEYQDLLTLPGVGRKVANVIRIEIYNLKAFPVDTHVEKLMKRLGIAKNEMMPVQIEELAYQLFNEKILKKLHHQFIQHGRTICSKSNPKCLICHLHKHCQYYKELVI